MKIPIIKTFQKSWDELNKFKPLVIEEIYRLYNSKNAYSLEINRTEENKLDKLSRLELLEILRKLSEEEHFLYLEEKNFPKRQLKHPERKYHDLIEDSEFITVRPKVRLVLSGKNRPALNRKNFVFNNLITCGQCGCKVLGEEKRKLNDKRYTYYHCTFSKSRHNRKGYVPENRLAKMFEEPVRRVTITQEQVEWIKEGLAITSQDALQSHKNRLSGLQSQYEKVSPTGLTGFLMIDSTEKCQTRNWRGPKRRSMRPN